jgi:hypothetical protein
MRVKVVLGWIGALSADQRLVLEQLIEGELAAHQPSRTFEFHLASGAGRAWIANARHDRQALLIALLELRESGVWRVYLVDAARSRAIVRELPGETAGNSAALEAVASVVSSAVRALDEGLEIASQPIAEVMGEPAPAAPVPRRLPQRVARELRLAVGLAPALATFAKPAAVTFGAQASLRLVLPCSLLFGVSVIPNWPAHFRSEFGSFDVRRTQSALSLGAESAVGLWRFSVEAGWALELLQRRVLQADAGAAARANINLTRIGAELTASGRYQLSRRLALEFALGGAYFPQHISYTLAPATERVLASPWRATGSALFGLEVSLLQ